MRHQSRSHDEVGEPVLAFGEAADDDVPASNVQVVCLFADEIGIRVAQCCQLVAQVVRSVDIVVVHLRNHLAGGSFDAAVETDSQGLRRIDLDDLEMLDTYFRRTRSQIGRCREPVGDEHEFLVRVPLRGMGLQNLAEVVGAIRRHHR